MGAWVRPGSASPPTLPLFPLEEVILEAAAASQLVAVVVSRAVWLGHGAELLRIVLAGVGMDTGTPGCLSPLAAPGLCRAPPQLALRTLA